METSMYIVNIKVVSNYNLVGSNTVLEVMDNAQNLPTLQDKRLSYVSRISRRTRKMTSISNDSLTRKTTIYDKLINREKRSFDFRSWQREKPFKEALLNVRSTQKCLKKHKVGECFENTHEFNYGIYGGIPLRALRHEIQKTIKEAHPRERRLREVTKLITDGKVDGRLVNYEKVHKSLDDIINRNYRSDLIGLISPTKYPFGDDPANKLRLPPIAVSRENTKELLRPKSGVAAASRYKTFMLEPATSRF